MLENVALLFTNDSHKILLLPIEKCCKLFDPKNQNFSWGACPRLLYMAKAGGIQRLRLKYPWLATEFRLRVVFKENGGKYERICCGNCKAVPIFNDCFSKDLKVN